VVLVEAVDFAKGTSSRSTKLVHGGVRYLAQGNISLVREALHERTTLLHNAPHLAQPLAFVMPSYQWWETPFYGAGLTAYDLLAGKAGLGRTRFLGKAETRRLMPMAAPEGLKGGVQYWDGQFNDARLALALARTAATKGALLVNYCKAESLQYRDDKICGLVCEDTLGGRHYSIQSRCVINATGVWVDALREQDATAGAPAAASQPLVAPSQGVHIVVEREFLGSDTALLVPKTRDGRVLFAVPWLGKVILGTTDTPRTGLDLEPIAFKQEVDFILTESARYLRKAPTAADIKSIWVGLRPLVKPPQEEGTNTKAISREHTVLVSRSGLVTVTGGKWTTYRAMAEDVLAHCADSGLVPARPAGATVHLPLVGAGVGAAAPLTQAPGLHSYGDEQAHVQQLPGQAVELCPGLTEAMVRFAARHEYAVTVEDMLARRARLLFLDAKLAAALAPRVAEILAEETGLPTALPAFLALARQYTQLPG
jgi:glycerol-3-phosphate dehydrogenase